MDDNNRKTDDSKEQEKEALNSKQDTERLEKTWEDEDRDSNESAISVGC